MLGRLATLPGAAPSLPVAEEEEEEPVSVPDLPFLLLGLLFLAEQVYFPRMTLSLCFLSKLSQLKSPELCTLKPPRTLLSLGSSSLQRC